MYFSRLMWNSFSTVIFVSQIDISLDETMKGLDQERETEPSRLPIGKNLKWDKKHF
jgi:hypothetical protein